MELHLKPIKSTDTTPLKDEDLIGLVSGLSNTIFKSVTVFLNLISSYVKLLKQLYKVQAERHSSCGFF